MDSLGQMLYPLPYHGVVGKRLWERWDWGSDTSPAGDSQLRPWSDRVAPLSLCFLIYKIGCVLLGRVWGSPLEVLSTPFNSEPSLEAGAPFSLLLFGCSLLAASSVLRSLLGLSPQQHLSFPSPPRFFWPAECPGQPPPCGREGSGWAWPTAGLVPFLLGVQRRSYLPRCTTLCLIQTFASLLAPNQSWEGMDGFILSGHVRPTPSCLVRWCGREA